MKKMLIALIAFAFTSTSSFAGPKIEVLHWWTSGGEAAALKVLKDDFVANAMAYSKPFVWDAMAELESKGVREILLLPMFPQYSSATTESIFHQVEVAAAKWQDKPRLKFVR